MGGASPGPDNPTPLRLETTRNQNFGPLPVSIKYHILIAPSNNKPAPIWTSPVLDKVSYASTAVMTNHERIATQKHNTLSLFLPALFPLVPTLNIARFPASIRRPAALHRMKPHSRICSVMPFLSRKSQVLVVAVIGPGSPTLFHLARP